MYHFNLNVIEVASHLHNNIWQSSENISEQTKKSQDITKKWQTHFSGNNFEAEHKGPGDNNFKFDLLERSETGTTTAYELKVSENNINHEFFKDIYKIQTYNLYPDNINISTLVFISHPKSIYKLSKYLDLKFQKMLFEKQNISIFLMPIVPFGSIGNLFFSTPKQWGLRGDPFLWLDLMRVLSLLEIPNSIKDLEKILLKTIEEQIGEKLTKSSEIYVNKYDFFGMSSGIVSGAFWYETGIPMILDKFNMKNATN